MEVGSGSWEEPAGGGLLCPTCSQSKNSLRWNVGKVRTPNIRPFSNKSILEIWGHYVYVWHFFFGMMHCMFIRFFCTCQFWYLWMARQWWKDCHLPIFQSSQSCLGGVGELLVWRVLEWTDSGQWLSWVLLRIRNLHRNSYLFVGGIMVTGDIIPTALVRGASSQSHLPVGDMWWFAPPSSLELWYLSYYILIWCHQWYDIYFDRSSQWHYISLHEGILYNCVNCCKCSISIVIQQLRDWNFMGRVISERNSSNSCKHLCCELEVSET